MPVTSKWSVLSSFCLRSSVFCLCNFTTFLRKLKSLRCFMSGSENMELAQQGKSLISYLLAAIAMGTRKHGLANSFILSQANHYIERDFVLG